MDDDFSTDNEKELYKVRRMKKEYTDMPPSMKHRIDTWEKCLMGDADAVIEMTILSGMATREEFDEIRDFCKTDVEKTP